MGELICKIAETAADLQEYYAVRHAIFVEEQGMFYPTDRDEYDEYAIHIISVDLDTGEVVGAVRCYEAEDGVWFGGRLAVLKAYRQNASSIGSHLCKLAEKTVIEHGCQRFLAHIQSQNVRFFERLRWSKVGEPVMHHGRPHQLMEASLAGAKRTQEPAYAGEASSVSEKSESRQEERQGSFGHHRV